MFWSDGADPLPQQDVGAVKEYRLAAWPHLYPPFDRIAHRRMLTDMSHRHVSMAQLTTASGMRPHEVREFLSMLESRGLVTQREASIAEPLPGPLRPLGDWLRRTFAPADTKR